MKDVSLIEEAENLIDQHQDMHFDINEVPCEVRTYEEYYEHSIFNTFSNTHFLVTKSNVCPTTLCMFHFQNVLQTLI